MKRILSIVLLATLLLTGCKDFLVEKPTLTQSNDMALSDYNGLVAATAGAYGPLVSSTWYGANIILESEIRAGNAMNPISSDFQSGRMTVPQQMNYNESSTSGLWSYGYYVTSAANNVLEAIETNGVEYYTKGGACSEQDLKNLQAECYFLRALAHFDMVRLYAHSWAKGSDALGVPVILKTDKTAQEKPARNTVAEVYAQVITDLTTAESLMDPAYTGAAASGASVKANVSLPAVQALLARVYLYKQDWNNASAYATKVIENGAYKLWTAKEYPTVWGVDKADTKGGEVIFEVYGMQANDYDAYWEGPSHMTNPEGYADVAATWALVEMFEAGDVRGTTGVRTKDEGKAMFCTDTEEKSGGQFWTMKYQGKGLGDAKSTPDVNNTIVLRLSEMYLIRAEAAINGAPGNAVADLNAIRTNRGASPLSSAGPEAVAKERRMELNFEGHLWFDLARTKGSVTYDSRETNRAVPTIAPDSHYWALPIPKRETDVNENLVQNSGY